MTTLLAACGQKVKKIQAKGKPYNKFELRNRQKKLGFMWKHFLLSDTFRSNIFILLGLNLVLDFTLFFSLQAIFICSTFSSFLLCFVQWVQICILSSLFSYYCVVALLKILEGDLLVSKSEHFIFQFVMDNLILFVIYRRKSIFLHHSNVYRDELLSQVQGYFQLRLIPL